MAAAAGRYKALTRRGGAWLAAVLAALAMAALLSFALPPVLTAGARLWTVPLTRRLAWQTLQLAALCAAICLVLGAPIAWMLRLGAERLRRARGLEAVSPFFLGLIARATGFLVVLGEFGLLNLVLRTLQIETEMPRGAALLAELAVLIGMVQVFAPFMVLALYRPMARIDIGTIRALRSLGMSHAAVFRRLALPLSRGGMVVGTATVFALATGAYVTVAMFGPRRVRALASVAYDQSTTLIGWQIAALVIGLGGVGLLLLARWLRWAAVPQRRPNSRPAAPRTSA